MTIPSGSITFFRQTTPPVGWTKLTDATDYTLRVVTGNASATLGGSINFTTVCAPQTPQGTINNITSGASVAPTTLSTPQIPVHTHTFVRVAAPTISRNTIPVGQVPVGVDTSRAPPAATTGTRNSGAGGGGGAHTHTYTTSSPSFTGTSINFSVNYVDLIKAQRD